MPQAISSHASTVVTIPCTLLSAVSPSKLVPHGLCSRTLSCSALFNKAARSHATAHLYKSKASMLASVDEFCFQDNLRPAIMPHCRLCNRVSASCSAPVRARGVYIVNNDEWLAELTHGEKKLTTHTLMRTREPSSSGSGGKQRSGCAAVGTGRSLPSTRRAHHASQKHVASYVQGLHVRII
jgi:hypothetical protein